MDDDLIARAARLGLCDEETARLKLGRDPATVRVLVEKGILRRQDIGALLRPDVEAAARDPANVFGKYVRLREIGRGGFSTVYLAYDRDLGRPVALKVLDARDPDDVVRFKREAMLAASLTHPNIAQIYEVGEAHERMYLAMQFVEGETAGDPPHALPRAVAVVRDAARAVHHANQQGIIHRDLKPENLMLDAHGRVYVMDFGLAKRIDTQSSISITGAVMGTPVYMPPEQARGSPPLDARTDVYALGATLYRLIRGERPFDGQNAYEIIHKVIHEEPPPLDAAVPADLRTVVQKAMSKEPGRRYGSAAELADDLDRFLNGEAVVARPATVMYRLAKRVGRNPWAWGLAGTVAVVALAAGLVVYFLDRGIRAREAIAQADKALYEWRMERYVPLHDVTPARRRLEAAAETLKSALELEPDAHEARAKLGWALLQLGRPEEARAALERTVEEAPNEGAYRWWLSIAYEQLLRRERVDAGRLAHVADRAEAIRRADDRWSPLIDREIDRAIGAPAWGTDTWVRDFARAVRHSRRREVDEARAICDLIIREQVMGREEASLLKASMEPVDVKLDSLLDAKRFAPSWARLRVDMVVYGWGLVNAGIRKGVPSAETLELLGAALHEADAAVMIDPQSAEVWHTRAWTRFALATESAATGGEAAAEFDRAIDDITTAIRLAPDAAVSWRIRGQIRTNRASFAANHGEDSTALYRAAVDEDFAEAIRLEPTAAHAYSSRAHAHAGLAVLQYRRGGDPTAEYEAAVRDHTRALELDPNFADAYAGRGGARVAWAVYVQKVGGDADPLYRAAIDEDLARAVELEPDDFTARLRLGEGRANWAYYGMSLDRDPRPLLQQAIDVDFADAIARRDNAAPAYVSRGVARVSLAVHAHQSREDPTALYEQAIAEDFNRALEIDPNHVEAWARRGETRSDLGAFVSKQGGDSTELFRAAIEVDYARALELAPMTPETWMRRGIARMNWGQHVANRGGDPIPFYRKALDEDFGRAIELQPNFGEAWYRAGLTSVAAAIYHAWKGDGAAERASGLEADRAFTRTIELNDRHSAAYLQRGYERRIHGSAADAAADLRRAVELNPLLESEVRPIIEQLEEY